MTSTENVVITVSVQDAATADLAKIQKAVENATTARSTSTKRVTDAEAKYQKQMQGFYKSQSDALTKIARQYGVSDDALAKMGVTGFKTAAQFKSAADQIMASAKKTGDAVADALTPSNQSSQKVVGAWGGLFDKIKGIAGKKLGDLTVKDGLIAGGLAKAGSALGGGVFDFLSGSINVARDQARASRNVTQLFGQQGSGAISQAAGTAAGTYGLSRSAYLSQSSDIGSSLIPAGATKEGAAASASKLIGLSADIAAMYGVDQSQVQQDLLSGVGGSYETLGKYGIGIDSAAVQGAARKMGKYGPLSDNDKTLAAVQAVLGSPGAAQAGGYFQKNAATDPNIQQTQMDAQIENAQGNIGRLLLPVLTKIMNLVKDKLIPLIDKLMPVMEAVAKTLGASVDVGTAAIDIVTGQVDYQQVGTDIMSQVATHAFLNGGKAKGGPVTAGQPYLVGEEGPELITPKRDGWVMTAAQTAAMGGNSGEALRLLVGGGSASAWGSILGGGSPTSAPVAGMHGAAPSAKYDPKGGTGQWSGLVKKAMAAWGLDPNGSDFTRIMNQMAYESGGNPNAQNNDDRNARAGNPSQGLLQVIHGTFEDYGLPGFTTNIRDPYSNIGAGIGWMVKNYGSVEKAIGPGGVRPYDDGGWLMPGITPANLTKKPEPVLTSQQWDIAEQAISQATASGGSSFGDVIFNIDGAQDPDMVAEVVAARMHDLMYDVLTASNRRSLVG